MKKTICIFLLLFVVVSLSSCGVNRSRSSNTNQQTNTTASQDESSDASDLKSSSLVDWREFVYAFFGAFLGFSSSLFIDYKVRNHSSKKQREVLFSNALEELIDIRKMLSDKNTSGKRVRFAMPSYNAIVHSGLILNNLNENHYKCMLAAYSQCEHYIARLDAIEERERLFGIWFCPKEKSEIAKFNQQLNAFTHAGDQEIKELSSKVITKIDEFQKCCSN